MKLVTTAQMRELERLTEAAGTDTATLMERAGLAVAQEAVISAGATGERIFLVLVGPGNNGGDGLVAARHLRDWDVPVHAYLLAPRGADDAPARDAAAAGVATTLADDDPDRTALDALLGEAVCVIDALLGTGQRLPLGEPFTSVLSHLARARGRGVGRPRLVACDLPTGVDADHGAVDPHAVTPDLTVAFGHAKVGTYVTPGAMHAGEVVRIDIGIAEEASAGLPYEDITLSRLRPALPARPADAHKGTFGRATLVGGSTRYPGALRLAGEAAARVGCGLVELAAPAEIQPLVAAGLPDAVHLPLPATDGALNEAAARALLRETGDTAALLVGPGLALTAGTHALVRGLLAAWEEPAATPVVWDADALSVLATVDGWWERLARPAVLTPHPGEMARLLRTTGEEVQGARLDCATATAARTGAVVVLKGAATIVAAPDGRAAISNVATSALAHAGSGDVLAGMLTGFLAQGMEPFLAAQTAVYLHGECGKVAGRALGAPSTLAQDLLRALPEVRRLMEPDAD